MKKGKLLIFLHYFVDTVFKANLFSNLSTFLNQRKNSAFLVPWQKCPK
jgi:hypothetical protein